MAIASFFVLHAPQDQQAVLEILGSLPAMLDVQSVQTEKTAATIELPGHELTEFLKKISALQQVLALELVFVNYEDDLDAEGHMRMPAEALRHG